MKSQSWSEFVLNNSILFCSLTACLVAVSIAFKPRPAEKLGLHHIENGNWSEAADSLKSSVEKDGGTGKAYLGLAKAHNHLERYDEGLQYADQALKHHPTDANIWAERAAAHLGRRDYKEALADAQEALTYDSTNERANQVMSRAETMLASGNDNLEASGRQNPTE